MARAKKPTASAAPAATPTKEEAVVASTTTPPADPAPTADQTVAADAPTSDPATASDDTVVADAATDEPVAPPAAPKTVRVVGPKKGRWRAGMHFGPEPTDIPYDDLSEDELTALGDDPKLSVTILPD